MIILGLYIIILYQRNACQLNIIIRFNCVVIKSEAKHIYVRYYNLRSTMKLKKPKLHLSVVNTTDTNEQHTRTDFRKLVISALNFVSVYLTL